MGKKSKVKKAAKKMVGKKAVGRRAVGKKAVGKAVGKSLLRGVPGVGTAMAAGDVVTAIRGSRGIATSREGQFKRRKGKIPKSVRKWASRIVSRRKQEEKLVKKLFGTGGGKVIKAVKKGSPGFITQEERLAALRR